MTSRRLVDVMERLDQPVWDTVNLHLGERNAFERTNLDPKLTNLVQAGSLAGDASFMLRRVVFMAPNAEVLASLKDMRWFLVIGDQIRLEQPFWNATEHGWEKAVLGGTPFDGYMLSFETTQYKIQPRQHFYVRLHGEGGVGPVTVLLDGKLTRALF
jgi:hypothetical protein